MQTVLTIAGFDPSSGAGVTADLMVFAAHGLFGTSAITSLTVQSTTGVRSTQAVEARMVRETLDCLQSDLPPVGVKIGMLASAAVVETVSIYLEDLKQDSPELPIVLDPVIRSSSGRELLSPDGLMVLRERLLPLATWATPNLMELTALTGLRVAHRADLEPACRELQRLLPDLNVLATGGHLDRPDDLLLTAEGDLHWLSGERIESTATHGTGCALSSALLSRLVLKDGALDAARSAKYYVAEAIRRAAPLGRGHGPLNHLWPMKSQD
jgi:hydroxymethylpyrimidine/phosphomethylpyrimidine kinase